MAKKGGNFMVKVVDRSYPANKRVYSTGNEAIVKFR
jgi:hypothetical protein